MRFTKMQGLGNDYVYVNLFEETVRDAPALARRISDRHFGVGSDGLVLIGPSERADFRMQMYNADGSRGAMCGNASRCIGKYVYERGLTDRTQIALETDSGVRPMRLCVESGRVTSVTVDMGEPSFDCARVPCLLAEGEALRAPLEALGRVFEVTPVRMGNPNAVVLLDEPVSDEALRRFGPALEGHPAFPEKANVEFIAVPDRETIRMRVWERGSGVTLACGSGASAAFAAARRLGLVADRARVLLDGGALEIALDAGTGHVLMSGPAAFVFDGDWPD